MIIRAGQRWKRDGCTYEIVCVAHVVNKDHSNSAGPIVVYRHLETVDGFYFCTVEEFTRRKYTITADRSRGGRVVTVEDRFELVSEAQS